MGTTHLIAEGRRLMFPSDREKADHDKRLTIAGEVISYRRKGAGDDEPELEIAYTRSFHRESWKFRVVALEANTGQLLATTLVETWAEARERLENELADIGLI